MTGDASYTATFSSVPITYTVTWRNWDDTVLRVDSHRYGDTPSYGGTPTRDGNAEFTYAFSEWSQVPEPVESNQTYWAHYSQTINEYTVTFGDGIAVTAGGSPVASGDRVPYGTDLRATAAPSDRGVPYIRAGGEEHMMSMDHEVVGDVEFTVAYYGGWYRLTASDGIEIYRDGERLDTPAYVIGGTVLAVVATGPSAVAVSGGAVVNGRFVMPSAETHIGLAFPVTFDPGEVSVSHIGGSPVEPGSPVPVGTVLRVSAVPVAGYEAVVIANGAAVSGGTVTVVSATDMARYLTPMTVYHSVVWRDWDGTVLERGYVEDGEVPVFHGAIPSRAPSGDTEYSFAGWSPAVSAARGDAVYTAVYDSRAVREETFSITWCNWDGTVLERGEAARGAVPVYGGAAPERTGHIFAGWFPAVSPASSDAVYTAVYEKEMLTVAIRGEGVVARDGGIVLNSGDEVPYGTVLDMSMEPRDGRIAHLVVSVGAVGADGTYTVTEDVAFTGSYTEEAGAVDGHDDDRGFPWWIVLVVLAAAYLAYRRYRGRERSHRSRRRGTETSCRGHSPPTPAF